VLYRFGRVRVIWRLTLQQTVDSFIPPELDRHRAWLIGGFSEPGLGSLPLHRLFRLRMMIAVPVGTTAWSEARGMPFRPDPAGVEDQRERTSDRPGDEDRSDPRLRQRDDTGSEHEEGPQQTRLLRVDESGVVEMRLQMAPDHSRLQFRPAALVPRS